MHTSGQPPSPKAKARQRLQPLYHQIYIQMRQMLTDMPQDPTCPLPSEPALAERYGVSRVTIRKTLEQLERDGLILRVHGKGTFPVSQVRDQGKVNISGTLDNLLSFDSRASARTLFWGMSEVDPALAQQLQSGYCLKIVRLRLLEGRPVSFTTLHVPEALAPLVADQQDRSEPLIQVLERQGITTGSAEQVLTAVPAAPHMAEELGIAVGSPMMMMRRLMLDAAKLPVLHQESCYPPDRFEYRMTLSRLSIGPIAQWTPVL